VTAPDAVPQSPSAQRIVLAAERLFATHGLDGVSLRQIAVEGGSANNSAVHYYFKSKHGLVAAIFRHRLPQIIAERRLLTARCDPSDLRSRLEAQFLPILTMAEAPDNHYVSFVEQLQRHERGTAAGLLDLPADGQGSVDDFRRDLGELLADVPAPIRRMRIAEGQAFCIHAAADRERGVASGTAVLPFELFANSLLDGIAGFLSAPVSEATRHRLDGAGDLEDPLLRLL